MMPLPRGPDARAITPILLLTVIPLVLASGCNFHISVGESHGTGGSGGAAPPPPDSSSSGVQCEAVSSSAGSSGGGGGGGTCVGPDGTGQTSAVCNMMEITPSAAGG